MFAIELAQTWLSRLFGLPLLYIMSLTKQEVVVLSYIFETLSVDQMESNRILITTCEVYCSGSRKTLQDLMPKKIFA